MLNICVICVIYFNFIFNSNLIQFNIENIFYNLAFPKLTHSYVQCISIYKNVEYLPSQF